MYKKLNKKSPWHLAVSMHLYNLIVITPYSNKCVPFINIYIIEDHRTNKHNNI